jgi:hypothetical protein
MGRIIAIGLVLGANCLLPLTSASSFAQTPEPATEGQKVLVSTARRNDFRGIC